LTIIISCGLLIKGERNEMKIKRNLIFCLYFLIAVNCFSQTGEAIIMSAPSLRQYYGRVYEFHVDTNGDGLEDSLFQLSDWLNGNTAVDRLLGYLTPGAKIIYDDTTGRKPFDDIGARALLSIITPDGRTISLERMFSVDYLKQNFYYLHKRLYGN
jgi:hypothetical protein